MIDRGVFEHLEVTVGVAETGDRPPADEPVDADGLAGLVVDEFDPRFLGKHRRAVPHLVPDLAVGANDLARRDAVDILGPDPHEVGAPSGDDPGAEASLP